MLSMLVNGISIGAVYALIAVGFALVFSILKFSNFAHGGMIACAAYIGYFCAYYLKTGLFLTLIITVIGGGLVGLFVEFIGFRRLRQSRSPLIYFFVSSITLSMLLENILTLINGTNFYTYPSFIDLFSFEVFGFVVGALDVIMLCVAVVVLFVLLFIIKKTKLGLALRAVSIDSETSGLMGVNSTLIVMATFFIAGAMAGVSGVFLGISYTVYPQLGQLVVKGFIASVVGGLGSLGGAVAGAFLLGIVEVVLVITVGAGLAPVIVFAVMLLFLLIRPQGIAGVFVGEKA